jgi:cytochrome P450
MTLNLAWPQRAYDPLSVSPLAFWAQTADEREAIFKVLRAERPVSWHPPLEGALVPPENDGVWVVTRHEHIGEVSRNPEIYCSSKGFQFEESSAFTPKQVSRIKDQIRNQAKVIVDELLAAGEGDFVALVSKRMPMWTIYETLGLDPERRKEAANHGHGLVSWADEEVAAGHLGFGGRAGPSGGQLRPRGQVHAVYHLLTLGCRQTLLPPYRVTTRRATPAAALLDVQHWYLEDSDE